ncbi:MAG: pyrimidine reductase family protein [Rhodococcus sp. (in: high G+C Gram-positive bacteria)]|uniref:pyrimidine reductase family protein n=1 Tax=Rhodococcus sp. TaxID=1831 RepID=UPI003BB1D511
MRRLQNATYFTPGYPGPDPQSGELTAGEIRELYAYPAPGPRPWVRANFVCSIDGAVSFDGVSGALGTPADKAVFDTLRELADVVLVGAGTARSENYGGARLSAEARRRRLASGMSAVPPIAVVSARAHLDPQSRLFTDTEVPPIVLTGADADPERVAAITELGARVVVVGTAEVTSASIVTALADLGLSRVLCEGGPGLFGQLTADDVVDELCLTTSPTLVGGIAGRITTSPLAHRVPMMPAHVLTDTDGTVLTRWVRLPRT